MATVDDKKIIFSMVGLNKTIQQNNKQVLKNIYLSFFYGAKIGIISCIDNLLKGASGQAVHNMNLMFNLEETVGLRLKPSAF